MFVRVITDLESVRWFNKQRGHLCVTRCVYGMFPTGIHFKNNTNDDNIWILIYLSYYLFI